VELNKRTSPEIINAKKEKRKGMNGAENDT